ncbi:hypothetical protein MRB53_014084 [Persea americana]|uniref:Uncharacterized protein n=1 Tax=Persea americana TaxID=3435 RepID=A0ACC2KA09_PERAE|nr:hypothetical protein MRB53_014084 [Persea americana]
MVSSSAMPVLSVSISFSTSKDVKHMLDTVPEIQSIPPEFILPAEKRPSSVHQGSIPDLSGLDGSDSERMWAIQEISSACKEW